MNKNKEKTVFDRITIQKNYCDSFTILYKTDVTNDTCANKVPLRIDMEDRHDLLDYLEDVMDLLYFDIDRDACPVADIVVPGYPIVALSTRNSYTKNLIIRIVRSWAKNE
jgi:hypothetical protein